jgi:hypothetical protein
MMPGPRKSTPPPFRRREVTLPDAELTMTLAERIRREVALEKASDEVEPPSTHEDQAPVVVVIGPDGVPQIAVDAEKAPETTRVADPAPLPKRR